MLIMARMTCKRRAGIKKKVSPNVIQPFDNIKYMWHCQETVSQMQQEFMTFKMRDKLKAMAVVGAFETGAAFGKFSAVAVLNDGAGISYGFTQFTHASGALAEVLERYLAIGGVVGCMVIEDRMPIARKRTKIAVERLAADTAFRNAIRAAAVTDEMRSAQIEIAFKRFLEPAVKECSRLGFTSPLSLAVVYDSMVHGSWEKIRDKVSSSSSPRLPTYEFAWVNEFVELRDRWLASIPRLKTTRYRTRFFLDQIKLENWELRLPLRVQGVTISDATVESIEKYAADSSRSQKDSAVGPISTGDQQSPPNEPANPQPSPPSTRPPTPYLDRIESRVNSAAAKYDQVERISTAVTRRNDAAKSMWTTVVGSISQTFWALFGLLAGVPREVWFVVAVIAALLMLLYLYRQIALGKIREKFHVTSFKSHLST
jgi:hypothetical protein